MLYLIDGYNLLFRFFHSEKKLETQRNLAIKFLQEKTAALKIKAHLIFDAPHREEDLPSSIYSKNLKIIYTPKNQSADEYILEKISLSKTPSQITLVTSDKSLQMQAKSFKAQIQSIDDFIDWLYVKEQGIKKESKNLEDSEALDTKQNIDRLLKIFEKKLKEDSTWD